VQGLLSHGAERRLAVATGMRRRSGRPAPTWCSRSTRSNMSSGRTAISTRCSGS
jgi:hypothetical protein